MRRIALLISTCLGVGYSPFAPGTLGALFIAVVYWFLPVQNTMLFVLLTCALFFIGVWSAAIAEKHVQEKTKEKNLHDPGIIVVDEVVGMLVALIAVPRSFKLLVIAFILFRIFDIVKPYPIRKLEKLRGGWGIMLDDVGAGIYANVIVQILLMIVGKNILV